MIHHCCFNFNIPMANVVEHLFMYLFVICKLSLVTCPLISFASFLIGFFYCGVLNIFHIFKIQVLCEIYRLQVFSPSL